MLQYSNSQTLDFSLLSWPLGHGSYHFNWAQRLGHCLKLEHVWPRSNAIMTLPLAVHSIKKLYLGTVCGSSRWRVDTRHPRGNILAGLDQTLRWTTPLPTTTGGRRCSLGRGRKPEHPCDPIRTFQASLRRRIRPYRARTTEGSCTAPLYSIKRHCLSIILNWIRQWKIFKLSTLELCNRMCTTWVS